MAADKFSATVELNNDLNNIDMWQDLEMWELCRLW